MIVKIKRFSITRRIYRWTDGTATFIRAYLIPEVGEQLLVPLDGIALLANGWREFDDVVHFVHGPFGHVQVNAIGPVQYGRDNVIYFGVQRCRSEFHGTQKLSVSNDRLSYLKQYWYARVRHVARKSSIIRFFFFWKNKPQKRTDFWILVVDNKRGKHNTFFYFLRRDKVLAFVFRRSKTKYY